MAKKNANNTINKASGKKMPGERSNNKQASKAYNRNGGKSMRGRQGRKDSNDPRINLDNARIDRVERDIQDGTMKPGANDASEFHSGSDLINAAGSLPFATILGSDPYATGANNVPGIMSIAYAPAYGDPSASLLNKAFQQIYSYIVHANSRNYKYSFPDLAMFILAGIEVYVAIAEAIRAYGSIKMYREQNMYLADPLVRALGFNPQNLRENLGNMWFDINNLIMQTRQIWVPNILPLMKRWIRMASTLYTDATGDRSQIYFYRRRHFFQLNETGSLNGTALEIAQYASNAGGTSNILSYKPYNCYEAANTGITWPQYRSMIQHMIDKLVASQDRGMIYGDILKAYGPEKIYAMPEVSVDYMATLEYNAEVLTQIENAVMGINFPKSIQQINTPEEAIVQCYDNKEFTNSSTANVTNYIPQRQILNFHIPSQPSPDMIAVATRLKPGSAGTIDAWVDASDQQNASLGMQEKIASNNGTVTVNMQHGTEITVWIAIWTKNTTNQYGVTYDTIDQLVTTQTAMPALKMMAFDWHPFLYTIEKYSATGTIPVGQPITSHVAAFGDFDNYIYITDTELKKLNDACLYGLLGIPQMG